MHCSNCGKDTPGDSRFCPYCGEVFKGGKSKKAEKEGKEGKTVETTTQETGDTSQTVHVYTQTPSAQQEFEHASAPIGVKIIAILVFLSGILAVLGSIILIQPALALLSAAFAPTGIILENILWGVLVLLPLIFGILYLWIGWGLWNLRRSALNWYLGLFLLFFILSMAEIYMYWYYWGWWYTPNLIDYVTIYITSSPWEFAGLILGWVIFFYLVAVRSKFNGYVPRKA